jgi:hypothetical protein
MLSFAVLLGGVWAQETNVYDVRGSEGVEFGVVELTTVITLYGCKRQIKLGMCESVKRGERSVCIRFLAHRNDPSKVSKIIKND